MGAMKGRYGSLLFDVCFDREDMPVQERSGSQFNSVVTRCVVGIFETKVDAGIGGEPVLIGHWQGSAACARCDTHVKEVGRKHALRRALAHLSSDNNGPLNGYTPEVKKLFRKRVWGVYHTRQGGILDPRKRGIK
jgi:hypothetical protein